MSTQNLSKMFTGEVLQQKTESEIAIERMNLLLSEHWEVDDATKLYADTIIQAIVDIKTKEDKSSRDYDTLLKYLKELETIINVKNRLWYRLEPASDVVYEDDLSG